MPFAHWPIWFLHTPYCNEYCGGGIHYYALNCLVLALLCPTTRKEGHYTGCDQMRLPLLSCRNLMTSAEVSNSYSIYCILTLHLSNPL